MRSAWRIQLFYELFIVILYCRIGACEYGHVLDVLLEPRVYEQRVRPLFYEKRPVNVTIGFTVIAADDINVNAMEFKLELRFSLKWNDNRLQHGYEQGFSIAGDLVKKIWMPDAYVVNAKKVEFHETTEPNQIMRISKDGTVEYSTRLSIVASCHVDLRMFPWDTQKCPIIIQSYGYPAKDIMFHWYDDGEKGDSFIERLEERPMAQYELGEFTLHNELVKNFQNSNDKDLWSSLEAVFAFRRLNGFYLIQVLAPSNILVVLSWVSFLINPDHAPARVFLGISCVLTMAAIQNFINLSLPKVSYIKIIDIYSLSCYFFVVLVMAEYALVLLLNDRVRKDRIFRKEKKIPTKSNHRIQKISSFCRFWPNLKLCVHGNPFCMHIPAQTGRTVDKTCIILFPVSYIIFNIAFWTHVSTQMNTTGTANEVVMDFFL